MTWTPSQPTGGSKIRLLPDLLEDRWNNIEGGEVPSRKWQLAFRAGDPGGITGSGLIYTKLNGAGKTELFYKDDDSHVIRMTNSGGVGYWDQSLYGSDVKLQTGSTQVTNTQQAFCCAHGRVSSNGTLQPGSYNIFSATRNGSGSGSYTVRFNYQPTTSDFWSVVCMPRDTSDSEVYTWTLTDQFNTAVNDSGFTVKFKAYDTGFDPPAFPAIDVGFCFAVFGGLVP